VAFCLKGDKMHKGKHQHHKQQRRSYGSNMNMESADICKNPYPTIDGVAIEVNNLVLPDSRLNPDNINNMNQHHLEFYHRWYLSNQLFRTFVNLDALQTAMMIDTHAILHERFGPPKMPTPYQARDFIEDQMQQNGNIRTGSYKHPTYTPLDLAREAVDRAYEMLGGREDKLIIDMGAI